MLALQHAYEIREAISGYLDATFDFSDAEVRQKFNELLQHPEQGLFKGPYISTKLPFKQAESDTIPLEIKPGFTPFRHQLEAFRRLSTEAGHTPEPTILTTGTGSGKTESFLFPLLDYCYKNQYRKGIKAIIMYPMNALATDQAKRLAEAIDQHEALKGRVTAGLFIGEGQGKRKVRRTTMGPENIIEDREVILKSPPDILLTNFKMLDFALIRGSFQCLWVHNHTDPSLFKFMVLDELHTYDGVQGTEVAMLIRRLKAKLNLTPDQLCPVGTSATLGSTEDSKIKLAEYASAIFGQSITTSSIIEETRLTLDEYFINVPVVNPLRNKPYEQMRFLENDTQEVYYKRQLQVWDIDENADRSVLGKVLKTWSITYDILKIASQQIISVEQLLTQLAEDNKIFAELYAQDHERGLLILQSLLTLLTEARQADNPNLSFAYIRVQLWVKALSQLQRTLGPENRFYWRRTANELKLNNAVPPFYCRDCGGTGWYVMIDDYDRLIADPIAIYDAIFKHRDVEKLKLLVERTEIEPNAPYKGERRTWWYNPSENKFFSNEQSAGAKNWPVYLCHREEHDATKNTITYHHDCPHCGSSTDLTIIGTGVPTLASVAASQTLATSLDDAPDKARKLLAFSNTVQDASHQAVFIQNRTYNFSYRFALLKAIKHLADPTSNSLTFDKLFNGFNDYWLEELQNEDNFVYRFFPPDKAGEVTVKEFLGKPELKKRLVKEIRQRNTWQLTSELGYNSRIGRTLEKSYSIAVDIDDSGLMVAAEELAKKLLTISAFRLEDIEHLQLLVGILNRIRLRGGLYHDYLADVTKHEASNFHLNRSKAGDRRPLLQPYLSKRHPHFAGTTTGSAKSLIDGFSGQANSWFADYVKKYISCSEQSLADVVTLVRDILINYKYLQVIENENNKQKLYFLNQSIVNVGLDYHQLSCKKCGHSLNATSDTSVMHQAKCLQYRCNGSYEWDDVKDLNNYYKKIYNRARVPRVYANEHTGLLDRDLREKVEQQFKQRPTPDATNVLVATSTLEMGIDIGDLNVVYNTATPPTPANFLQRIGRAGRKSGSALVVNFAGSKEHDQFYFDDPLDMMEGEVSPPGCFLNAKDILRRHLLAYYLDEYANQNPTQEELFSPYQFLGMTNDLTHPDFFGNKVSQFITINHEKLFETFKYKFDHENVSAHIWTRLNEETRNGLFTERLLAAFEQLKTRRDNLEKQRSNCLTALKDPKLNPTTQVELKKAVKNFSGLINKINETRVVEYLTDQGLLPNYAFPETGISLNASISYKTPKQDEWLVESLSLTRSAKSGLRELAPGNFFHTQGYKLRIDGIEVLQKEEVRSYRACPNCDHIDTDTTKSAGGCPKCTAPNWASDDSIINAIDFRTAKAETTKKAALSEPSHDDRDVEQYKISLHFDLYNRQNSGAHVMEDIPFGIELVRQVEIREFNLGQKETGTGSQQTINGQQTYKNGFVVCKHCNKATLPSLSTSSDKFHYPYCRDRNKGYQDKDASFHSFYLGRSFTTEVIKILLPIDQFNRESKIALFKAGLQLGLNKMFKASVQHLEFAPYNEFNHRLGRADNYLILYDTIPGGSGFLDELMKVNIIKEVIVKAYELLKGCSCKEKGLDGCYKCVYSYGNQYSREDLTRSEAERLFKEIIDYQKEMVEVDSLGTVNLSGKLEESELESAFVDHFKVFNISQGGTFDTIEGVEGREYTFSLPGSATTFRLRPQVEVDLGTERTRVDFMITTAVKPEFKLALYLDGYQYHASQEHFRLHDDLKKREALLSLNYKVIALTYEDVNQLHTVVKDAEGGKVSDKLFQQLTSLPIQNIKAVEGLRSQLQLERLENYLGNNITRLLTLLQSATEPMLAKKYLKLLAVTVFQPSIDSTMLGNSIDLGLGITLSVSTAKNAQLNTTVEVSGNFSSISSINRDSWRILLAAMNMVYLAR